MIEAIALILIFIGGVIGAGFYIRKLNIEIYELEREIRQSLDRLIK